MRTRLLVLVLALASGSCLERFEPDVGGRSLAVCDPRDTDPSYDVSFAEDILPLILRDRAMGGCSCHQPTNTSHVGYDLTHLDLSSHDAMRRGGINSEEDIVVEGDPCSSVLYLKTGFAPPFGARMPASGPPFWSADERALLHDWIAEGAHDN